MKTTFTRKHAGIVILTLILLGILHYTGVSRPIEQTITRVVNPIIRTVSGAGTRVGAWKNYFTEKATLLETIHQLEDALHRQQSDSAERTLLTEENDALREQLRFAKRTARTVLTSYVVGKTIDNTANTLIIDRGSNDGVALGSAVIVGDGILAGKIAKVNPRSAIVRLLNDPRSKVAASVLNKDKSIGLVEGGFGISVKLTTVLQNETLTEGDIIVTSGLEESIPRGLLVGTVATVEKESYRPFQSAIITPAAPLSRLTIVGVLPL